ncbi:MAG: hypothetical protein AAFN74_00720, partial [Myxococcota bacterium]
MVSPAMRWGAPAAATAAVMVVFAVAGPARMTSANLGAATEQAQHALDEPERVPRWAAYNKVYRALARRLPAADQIEATIVAVELGRVLLETRPEDGAV